MVSEESWHLLLQVVPFELWNTVYMVLVSTALALFSGGMLGMWLYLRSPSGLAPHAFVYRALGFFVNIGRSTPFAILMVALIPLTRLLLGTSVGTTASIVPLTIAAIPAFARLLEASFLEVNPQLLLAARLMGASSRQIIIKVLLPESLPGLINAGTQIAIQLVGYSAMAGLIGGGGLGKVAIQYGYQRFNPFIMVVTVLLMFVLVQTLQGIGNYLSLTQLRKRGIVL